MSAEGFIESMILAPPFTREFTSSNQENDWPMGVDEGLVGSEIVLRLLHALLLHTIQTRNQLGGI